MKEQSKVPLLSICCTTFNHKNYIAECLNGFINQQTDFDFEILVHDDASTDGTTELVKQFELDYPGLFNNVYQEVNQFGKINTLTEILFKKAKGKYIALCEGDDYWTDPLKLQKQVDFLDANMSYSACFHLTQELYSFTDKKGRIFGKHNNKLDFSAIDTICTISPWHTSSFVFRKNTYFNVDWFANVVSGDLAIFSIVSKSGKIRCVPEVMSVYRKHDRGITTSKSLIDNYHQDRIKLAINLNKLHDFKYASKVKKVINFHKRQIYLLKYQGKWVEKIVSKFLTFRYPI